MTIRASLKNKFIVTLLLIILPVTAISSEQKNKGDRKGHVMKDVIPKNKVPPAPILTVQQALKSMHLQPGFVLENVVSEPNVFNPVAMVFDGDGKIWVCEMTRYMPDTFGTGEEIPEGNIAVLEDTNGDGKIDKRTVFLNDIILPRTISLVKGGIFYADHTQLYFTEIINDGKNIKPGFREVVDPTYAKGGSLEHKTNTMLYGMDNWYYNAKSDKKYQILNHEAPVPKGAQEIYRNKYWKAVRAQSDWRGQWGLTMDDYGRLYHNGNSQPAQGEYLMPNSLLKNPGFWGRTKAYSIGDRRIYSVRMNTGINRGYIEGMLATEGEDRGKLKEFTAASGSLIYRGDNFPEKFYGMAITPEPAGNLISARHIIENEGTLDGKPVFEKSEILASTDERFRPVNLYNAPDGTLYLLDMYHGILQHKEFITTYLSDQIKDRELDKNNNTMGRIYRLRWQEKQTEQQPQLLNLSAAQLVPYLFHSNGWWRDKARQLIVQSSGKKPVANIKSAIKNSDNHIGIINAIWTLYGLNAIDFKTIKPLLLSEHVKVQTAAIIVSPYVEQQNHKQLADVLTKLSKTNYELAIQIALVAGHIDSDDMLKTSLNILNEFINKPQIREAVVSGLGEKSQQFNQLLSNSHEAGIHPDPDFMYIMNNLGKQPEQRTNRDQLSEPGKTLYDLGKELYFSKGACFGCHGNDGRGIKGMGPTFWQTQWVVKDPEILAKVMLHGLMGDIKIKSQTWQTSMVMPGMAARTDVSDKDLAAIATFIRNSWGNTADTSSHVDPELFKKLRLATKNQQVPYTQETINFP